MVDYVAVFKASFARVAAGEFEQRFLDGFYEKFIAANEEVAAMFKDTDFHRQKQMLKESLVEMMEFCTSLRSNPYIVTLARVHGVRGRDIPQWMFELWLECLVQTVAEVDPEYGESVELAWRVVMAPGIQFMAFYRDR